MIFKQWLRAALPLQRRYVLHGTPPTDQHILHRITTWVGVWSSTTHPVLFNHLCMSWKGSSLNFRKGISYIVSFPKRSVRNFLPLLRRRRLQHFFCPCPGNRLFPNCSSSSSAPPPPSAANNNGIMYVPASQSSLPHKFQLKVWRISNFLFYT